MQCGRPSIGSSACGCLTNRGLNERSRLSNGPDSESYRFNRFATSSSHENANASQC